MKCLLIEPKGINEGLNIGLGYIASTLRSNGHDVRVIDLNNKQESVKERIDNALDWEPDVIGFSIKTTNLDESCKIAKFCLKKSNDAFFIAGGPHITMEQTNFMREYKDIFDCAVIGECEITIIELLNVLEKNRKVIDKVKGIIFYNENEELIRTEPRPLIKDLDTLPFPNYHVFDSVENDMLTYPIITSRGCPYECVFCLSKCLWGRVWRPRSPENVIEEIKDAKNKYKIKYLDIWDDNFTLNRKRAENICDLMISENLDLQWTLPNGVRADKIDLSLLKKMKKAGCTRIKFGIENADPETFSYVKKGETLEDIEKAVSIAKKVGIEVNAFMIIGLINTTYGSFLKSLNFVKTLGIKTHWYPAVPYPNTELYAWVKREGRFLKDYKKGFHAGGDRHPPIIFDTPEFPANERIRAYYLGNLRCKTFEFFYSEGRSLRAHIQTILKILRIAWKYDRIKFPFHIVNVFLFFVKRALRKMMSVKNYMVNIR